MKNPLKFTLLGAATALSMAGCAHATASPETPSYTSDQADAGATAYQLACVVCHTAELSGSGEAPALTGRPFSSRWNGRSVAELIGFAREHMPRTIPGVLNDRTYLAVVAYLLSKNGMPTGESPLRVESTWTIEIGSR